MSGPSDRAVLGDNNAICQICGRKYKASQLRKRWDGFLACKDDWHPRQPQDFVRGVKENQLAPIISAETADTFVPYCDLQSSSSVSGTSTPGCWVVGKPAPYDLIPPSTF